MHPPLPPYFDRLIAARRAGHVGRNVHLGYWDDPPDLATPCLPGEFERAQERLTEHMIDLVPLRSGQRVLDVACGFGGTLAAIDAQLHAMQLTGLNIDRRQLELCGGAVRRPGNRLTLTQADACAMPFRAGAFDHVFCVEAMFHFRSRPAFLSEAARLLQPGGVLAITDILLRQPDASSPWDHAMIEAIVQRDYGPWPDPWADRALLLGLANKAGLELIHQADWTAATQPTYRIVAPNTGEQTLSAGAMFRWMHTNGWLTYQALVFRRR